MKPLYTEQEFATAKSAQKLPCECVQCGLTFLKPKNEIQDFLCGGRRASGCLRRTIEFCSRQCADLHRTTHLNTKCKQCDKDVVRTTRVCEKNKSGNFFCSHSCSAKWNNVHKTKGTRVSKCEVWLSNELPKLYPSLEFHFNRKDAINGELDIYIPSLKLAFELNGIFHYEPIYGSDKLAKTQSNDNRKFQACIKQGIELCIIDVSSMINFKPHRAEIFFSIIKNIINFKLSKN